MRLTSAERLSIFKAVGGLRMPIQFLDKTRFHGRSATRDTTPVDGGAIAFRDGRDVSEG